jgi:UDP-N-acetylglucosamine acyltransferase
MPTEIHVSAVIDPDVELGENVTVGPFCVVHGDVVLGSGTKLESHVVIESGSRVGRDCQIWSGSVIGGPPQDHKYSGERSFLILGDNNLIRECCTLHRAVGEGAATRIGNGNWFMAYSHVGHNCDIGDNNTIASYAGLSGHVSIENGVVIGGMVGVHQYSRIGKLAMVGGFSKINQDVPPFMMADGVPSRVIEINRVGLKRNGVSAGVRSTLRQAYKLLYRSNLNKSEAIERIEEELEPSDELEYLLDFLRGTSGGFGGRGNEKPRT